MPDEHGNYTDAEIISDALEDDATLEVWRERAVLGGFLLRTLQSWLGLPSSAIMVAATHAARLAYSAEAEATGGGHPITRAEVMSDEEVSAAVDQMLRDLEG